MKNSIMLGLVLALATSNVGSLSAVPAKGKKKAKKMRSEVMVKPIESKKKVATKKKAAPKKLKKSTRLQTILLPAQGIVQGNSSYDAAMNGVIKAVTVCINDFTNIQTALTGLSGNESASFSSQDLITIMSIKVNIENQEVNLVVPSSSGGTALSAYDDNMNAVMKAVNQYADDFKFAEGLLNQLSQVEVQGFTKSDVTQITGLVFDGASLAFPLAPTLSASVQIQSIQEQIQSAPAPVSYSNSMFSTPAPTPVSVVVAVSPYDSAMTAAMALVNTYANEMTMTPNSMFTTDQNAAQAALNALTAGEVLGLSSSDLATISLAGLTLPTTSASN